MKQTLVILVGVCMSAIAVNAAEVSLTWQGGAAEPNWSLPANWKEGVAPVAGDGNDYFLTFSNSVEVVNDVPGIRLKSVVFAGTGVASLSGEEIWLVGYPASNNRNKILLDNVVALTVAAPVKFTGYGTIEVHDNSLTVFEGAVTSDGKTGMITVNKTNGKNGPSVVFNAPITMPQVFFRVSSGFANSSASSMPVTMNAPICVSNFVCGCYYKAQYVDLASTGNVFRLATVQFGSLRAQCAHAFPRNLVMDWGNSTVAGINDGITYQEAESVAKTVDSAFNAYDLNGYDQTVDRVNLQTLPAKQVYQINSSRGATLTMKASANGCSYARVNGKVSVKWDPQDDYTLTWANRTNVTEGAFEVVRGTLALVNGVQFPYLSRMVVRSGASVTVDAASGPALFGATPAVQLVVDADDATVSVPAGVTVKVASLVVKGVRRSNCTVRTGDADAPWLAGGGSVQVAADAVGDVYWKEAVDGAWSLGSTWLGDAVPGVGKTAVLDVKDSSYAVTVDADVGAVWSNNLRLGGFSPDGKTATLVVARDVRYTGENATVEGGGAWAVTNGTFTVREKDASHQNVIRLKDGGVFKVDGGDVDMLGNRSLNDTFNIGFIGDFTVENGGRLEIDSGTFSFCSYYPTNAAGGSQVGNKGMVENPLKILPGGVMAIRGGRAKMRTQDYWGPGLLTNGGKIEVSGDGVLDLCDGMGSGGCEAHWFGRGEVIFKDRARLEFTGQVSQRFAVPYEEINAASGTCRLEFRDSSVLCCTNDSTLQRSTMIPQSRSAWNTSVLTLASDAHHLFGQTKVVVSANAGRGVLNVSDGVLDMNAAEYGYGLYLGDASDSNVVLPGGADVRPAGEMNVSGGAVRINARRGAGQTRISGLTLGNGIYFPKKPNTGWTSTYACGPDTCYSGALTVSGTGVVTNMGGAFAVGAGFGKGVVSQTGGEIVADSATAQNVIGLMGGKGVWTLAGGRTELAGNLWVGGVRKSATSYYSNVTTVGYMKKADGTYAEFDCADRHDAKGELVVSNGTFAVGGNLVLSADGTGSLKIGGGGLITAGNFAISNAATTVTIRLGADGSGRLAITGDIDVAVGAKLVIDASAVDTESFTGSKVLTYGTATRMFVDADITFVGKDGLILRKTATGLKVSNPRGLVIMLR